MTAGEIKDIAAAIQSVAVAVAVLIGGAWALFRFKALNEQARARADLDRLQYELQRRATVHLSLSTEVVSLGPTHAIAATVAIENKGTKPEIIEWARAGIRSADVTGFRNGTPVLGDIIHTGLATFDMLAGSNIDPGETAAYPFLVPAVDPGLHYVEFYFERAPDVSAEDLLLQKAIIIETVTSDRVTLNIGTFVVVPK